MKFCIATFAAAFCLICFSHAQSEKERIPKTDTDISSGDRTFRIVFPERPNSSPKSAYLFDGKESQLVSLPSMNFSRVIAIRNGEVMLYLTDEKITDPENVPPNAPRLRIPEEVREFYILMTPDTSNATLPLRMNLVNTSDGKLSPGETLWFNLTGHRVIAKLGDSKLSVSPKSSSLTKDPAPESGYYRAEFALQADEKGQFRKIADQKWWHDAKSRHVGFIVDTGGRLPKIYCFRDFRL